MNRLHLLPQVAIEDCQTVCWLFSERCFVPRQRFIANSVVYNQNSKVHRHTTDTLDLRTLGPAWWWLCCQIVSATHSEVGPNIMCALSCVFVHVSTEGGYDYM